MSSETYEEHVQAVCPSCGHPVYAKKAEVKTGRWMCSACKINTELGRGVNVDPWKETEENEKKPTVRKKAKSKRKSKSR